MRSERKGSVHKWKKNIEKGTRIWFSWKSNFMREREREKEKRRKKIKKILINYYRKATDKFSLTWKNRAGHVEGVGKEGMQRGATGG